MIKFKLPKTIGIRLTLWFTILLLICQIIFFCTTYFFLSNILQKRDFNDILTETSEIKAEFKAEGLEGFYTFVNYHLSSRLKELIFIRIATDKNKTLFKFYPKSSGWFKTEMLESREPHHGNWMSFSSEKFNEEINIYTENVGSDMYIQVGMNSSRRDSILYQFKKLFIIWISPFVLFSLVFIAFFSVKFLQPVRNIINTVKSIELGKMDSRVPRTWRNDELDELAGLFNQMLEKIESLINGMKESLDNTAHDLRTPLTRLRNMSEKALQNYPDQQLGREAHENAIEESERILKILETIMNIAEAENGIMELSCELKDLYEIVYPVYDLYQYIAETKNISIEMDIKKGTKIFADPEKISQALANIIDNAVKFTPENGKIFLTAEKNNNHVEISVEDTGTGVDENDEQKIFERLYRSKKNSDIKGLGLGLSLVEAIVKAHNGKVFLDKNSSTGAVFKIILPS